MTKLLQVFSFITAVVGMIVVPPLGGMIAYGLWLQAPLPFDMSVPALLAGAWAAVVIAAIIKQGFEQ